MNRRSFIKTITAATAAPLALLATKPVAKFIPDKAFQDALTEVVSKKIGDTYTEPVGGRVFRYIKYDPNAATYDKWCQVVGQKRMKVSI